MRIFGCRRPFDYEVKKLPVKLPPVKQSLPILSLPMLGYMEQSVATPIINSLTAVGCFKPKFPFLTATQSALIFVALHLKGKDNNVVGRMAGQNEAIGTLSDI